MKAKVIIENDDYGKDFKVRRMNYNEVIINYPTGTGLKTYKYEDIELISEGEIDDFLINNKEFLQIKLNRGISVFLYKALKESLEEEVDGEVGNIILLRDRYSVNTRGIWEKELICVINENIPMEIRINGRKFKREGYSITINRLEKNSFIQSSKEEISKISEEISRKKELLIKYDIVIKSLKNTGVEDDLDVWKSLGLKKN